MQKYSRRRNVSGPMFALGVLPLERCEWNRERVLCYDGRAVEVQVTGVVWDLNFHLGGRLPAQYDISVGFPRRGDRNALGRLIKQFSAHRKYIELRRAYER